MRKMAVIFRFICVRHGETQANKEMRVQGHIDIPLNKTGEAQAKEAGSYLNSVNFTRAYTSDLLRAKATCDNIIDKNNMSADMVKTDVRIRERDFGSVDGMLIKEVQEMMSAKGLSWRSYNPPNAETQEDVQQRFVDFFKELCQSVYDQSKNNNTNIDEECTEDLETLKPSETILVVSHGVALKQIFSYFEKTLECQGFPQGTDVMLSPNTAISEFLVKYSPRRYHLKCLRLYDAKHLENLKSD